MKFYLSQEVNTAVIYAKGRTKLWPLILGRLDLSGFLQLAYYCFVSVF